MRISDQKSEHKDSASSLCGNIGPDLDEKEAADRYRSTGTDAQNLQSLGGLRMSRESGVEYPADLIPAKNSVVEQ